MRLQPTLWVPEKQIKNETTMSWGTKIVITFVVFISGMLGMVLFVAGLQMDLVENNYYEKEIKYQDEIDILTQTGELDTPLKIKYNGKEISFVFPEQRTMPTGEIHFYRPSDAAKDFKISLGVNENRIQNVDTGNLSSGLWKVNVTWYADNRKFLKEESIYIN